ncbi:NADH-quinone oxidoreductase subunit L [Paenibacillus sp. HB172176]|uniref:NADH-quinone oxidoreductase subunit L n=1 Tax=Paenibacillus sp. HB172176 TaxID=2493690 RepID=UPI001438E757|nr:NADH-quinone oxidoreductase subunit L [Paenibacillus sp. HB172176]
MDFYTKIAWIIPMFPFLSFLILTALGRSYRMAGAAIGSSASLLSLLMSLLLLYERLQEGALDYSNSFEWISMGSFTLQIGYEITNLTAMMLVVVSLVSFLVNVYSAGYMKDDERIAVFYSYMSLFAFSMFGLVLSDNILSMYIFWELVGVCSFLLVGFWYSKPSARAAAKKAFIVTRIGDAGLLIAVLLLFWYMPDHALDFTMIQSVFQGQAGSITSGITTAIALLIFLGAMGKSGQFPLHVWLPDAMEGPTPISALIHAATMVAAGVFLVARTFDIFEASAAAMHTVAYVGGFTALFAATIALAQNDLKRILAYSTISQLGYMMMALGLGSITGGMFHLFTHAFFKALLFLGAGSVIHAVHTQDVREMGGLGSRMRITAWTFAIGSLALVGIPPLAGFWSKDAILGIAFDENKLLFAVGLAAAFCTALYMARLFILVFLGESRGEKPVQDEEPVREGSEGAGRSLESPMIMTLPLLALAVLAAVAGFVETPWSGWLSDWLGDNGEASHGSAVIMILSTIVLLLGLYTGWALFRRGGGERLLVFQQSPWLNKLLERGYYMDELYELVFVKSLKAAGDALNVFDKYIIGGLVRLTGALASSAGRGATRLQNGQVQAYSLAAIIGILLFVIAIVGRRLLS